MSFRSGCHVGVWIASLTALASGCVANDTSISINRFLAPDTTATTAGVCYDVTSMNSLARGTFDVVIASNLVESSYFANFAVENNLEAITTEPIDQQAYYVNSFDVELDINGPIEAVIPSSKRQFSFPVASQRLAPGDVAGFAVDVIDSTFVPAMETLHEQHADLAPSTVNARIRPVSTRAEEQQTGAFTTLPIDICFGCLLDPGPTLPGCSAADGVNLTTPTLGNSCNFAQDASVTCCQDTGGPVKCGSGVIPSTTM